MAENPKARSQSERLYVVENNIEHINQSLKEIKNILEKQDAREKDWLTKFQADMMYAKKETETSFQSLKNDFQKIFWGALAGLVAVVAFFIRIFFFNK